MSCHTKLKADRPHPCNYLTHRQIPRTDNDSSSAVRGRTDGRYKVHYLPASLTGRPLIIWGDVVRNEKKIVRRVAEKKSVRKLGGGVQRKSEFFFKEAVPREKIFDTSSQDH